MNEYYQPIEGYPGYRVSKDGEVQSCWGRNCGNSMSTTWFALERVMNISPVVGVV
jgi:hypothetical protein